MGFFIQHWNPTAAEPFCQTLINIWASLGAPRHIYNLPAEEQFAIKRLCSAWKLPLANGPFPAGRATCRALLQGMCSVELDLPWQGLVLIEKSAASLERLFPKGELRSVDALGTVVSVAFDAALTA